MFDEFAGHVNPHVCLEHQPLYYAAVPTAPDTCVGFLGTSETLEAQVW
jgi:hypothetical protein